MTSEEQLTSVLQIVRLKGRITAVAVAVSLGLDGAEVSTLLQTLKSSEAVSETNGNFRITPAGREQLAQRVAQEHAALDRDAMHAAYEAFHPLNTAFKQLVTDWQVRDGVPNDHGDADYDAGILQRLSTLAGQFAPLLDRCVGLAPRLEPYSSRFAKALQNLQAGDRTWFARPILDSYHTVWFELHEDLIGLLGLSRESEAAAGRAQ